MKFYISSVKKYKKVVKISKIEEKLDKMLCILRKIQDSLLSLTESMYLVLTESRPLSLPSILL